MKLYHHTLKIGQGAPADEIFAQQFLLTFNLWRCNHGLAKNEEQGYCFASGDTRGMLSFWRVVHFVGECRPHQDAGSNSCTKCQFII